MALDKWERQHVANIAKYEKEIQQIYATAIAEATRIGAMASFNPSKPFSFADFPLTAKLIENLQRKMAKDIEAVVTKGIEAEFDLSEAKYNELAERIFGDLDEELIQLRTRAYIVQRNAAREAFNKRRGYGLNLSDRVWKYTGQFREEIEMALDLGMRDGKSADELSREVRKYLNNPNMLFRRVRDEHGVLHLSKRAKAYHPGQGVYRSSYKNARRLTATETNIAYRSADYEHNQALDFVVGIRVMLSNNHTLNGEPFVDICDYLSAPNGSTATKGKGCYPKDFKFTGWHPLCRCFTQAILKTDDEVWEDTKRIMRSDKPLPANKSKNYVNDVPDEFKAWCRLNAGRVERAKSLPYFIRDNQGYYDSVIVPKYGAVQGVKLGRTAEKEAYRLYKDLPAPKLSKEVETNTKEIANSLGLTHTKPMTFLEANEGRSNVNYSKGLEYKENCQCCVVTHEARLRGLNITSVGYNYNRASMSWRLGERFEMAWINPKTNNIPVVQVVKGNNDNATLLALEKQMQAVGRYHVGVNFKNGSGHIITAERLKNGNLIYYDAQNGEFLNIKDYAALDYLEVLKVDKLLINKDVLMEIVELL